MSSFQRWPQQLRSDHGTGPYADRSRRRRYHSQGHRSIVPYPTIDRSSSFFFSISPLIFSSMSRISLMVYLVNIESISSFSISVFIVSIAGINRTVNAEVLRSSTGSLNELIDECENQTEYRYAAGPMENDSRDVTRFYMQNRISSMLKDVFVRTSFLSNAPSMPIAQSRFNARRSNEFHGSERFVLDYVGTFQSAAPSSHVSYKPPINITIDSVSSDW